MFPRSSRFARFGGRNGPPATSVVGGLDAAQVGGAVGDITASGRPGTGPGMHGSRRDSRERDGGSEAQDRGGLATAGEARRRVGLTSGGGNRARTSSGNSAGSGAGVRFVALPSRDGVGDSSAGQAAQGSNRRRTGSRAPSRGSSGGDGVRRPRHSGVGDSGGGVGAMDGLTTRRSFPSASGANTASRSRGGGGAAGGGSSSSGRQGGHSATVTTAVLGGDPAVGERGGVGRSPHAPRLAVRGSDAGVTDAGGGESARRGHGRRAYRVPFARIRAGLGTGGAASGTPNAHDGAATGGAAPRQEAQGGVRHARGSFTAADMLDDGTSAAPVSTPQGRRSARGDNVGRAAAYGARDGLDSGSLGEHAPQRRGGDSRAGSSRVSRGRSRRDQWGNANGHAGSGNVDSSSGNHSNGNSNNDNGRRTARQRRGGGSGYGAGDASVSGRGGGGRHGGLQSQQGQQAEDSGASARFLADATRMLREGRGDMDGGGVGVGVGGNGGLGSGHRFALGGRGPQGSLLALNQELTLVGARTIETLMKRKEELSRQIADVRLRVEELRRQSEGLRREIATTQQAIDDRDACIARNEALLGELTATMATLCEKYELCEQEINGISHKNQELSAKTETMTREAKLRDEALRRTHQEVDRLRRTKVSLESDRQEHDRAIDNLAADKARLQAIADELTAKVAEASTDVARLHADNRRARVALSAIRMQLQSDGEAHAANDSGSGRADHSRASSYGGDDGGGGGGNGGGGGSGHVATSSGNHRPPRSPAAHVRGSRRNSTASRASGGGGGGDGTALSVAHDRGRRSSTNALEWTRGQLLGEGAFSVVYLGLNKATGELLAVKQLKKEGLGRLSGAPSHRHGDSAGGHGDGDAYGDHDGDGRGDAMAELEEEIGLMRRLRHKHIVRYLGTSRIDTKFYILLEFVPGGSIASMLGRFGPFPEPVIRKYARQILEGLAYLHGERIVHRDVKGANILVNEQGQVKLADFGCSTLFDGMSSAPDSQAKMLGSVPWMAPEVTRQAPSGRKSDVWSLGCTVVEMSTGRRPWSGYRNHLALLYHIGMTRQGPSPAPGFSDAGRDFLAACFQPEPADRPSAEELLHHPWLAGASDMQAADGGGGDGVAAAATAGDE